MNNPMIIIICMVLAYLYGNILFAIPITKIFSGQDIRTIGNKNPGTSNTFKHVGPIPGTLVFFLDMSKGLIPVLLVRVFLLTDETMLSWIGLYMIGIAAILGHTRPIWNRFKKGGGGMGTAIGLFAFFVPIEYFFAMVIGIIITYTSMKDAQYKFGRWVVMWAALFVPFIVLGFNKLLYIKLVAHISFGGHHSGIVIGTFALLIVLIWLNINELLTWLKAS